MAENVLFIGTRRYSSWSMRGWLAVRLAGLAVQDEVVALEAGLTRRLQGLTPTGLVPALRIGSTMLWDSLAIGEYCAEQMPSLWPRETLRRAVARSVAAEMHAGFRAVRIAMPMNLGRADHPVDLTPDVTADIARIDAVWSGCLAEGGPYLFGDAFTIADVMYAPVVARFLSYRTAGLSELSRNYLGAVRQHDLVDEWYRLAAAEPVEWRLAKYEA